MRTRTLFSATAALCLVAVTAKLLAADDAPPPPQEAAAGKSFQIESVANPGRLVRPEDANSRDGTPIVLYPQQAWKCMTWKFDVPAGTTANADCFRLVNHFTHKTLAADNGDAVVERPADAAAPLWKFVKLPDGMYRIEQPATGRALTATADGGLAVKPWTSTDGQKWRLLSKPAKFTG